MKYNSKFLGSCFRATDQMLSVCLIMQWPSITLVALVDWLPFLKWQKLCVTGLLANVFMSLLTSCFSLWDEYPFPAPGWPAGLTVITVGFTHWLPRVYWTVLWSTSSEHCAFCVLLVSWIFLVSASGFSGRCWRCQLAKTDTLPLKT